MIAASSTKQSSDDRDDIAAKIHQYALAGEDEKILVRIAFLLIINTLFLLISVFLKAKITWTITSLQQIHQHIDIE